MLVFVFTDSDQNFWYKLYQIENLWSKLVSDGDLEILLDNSDDVNTNELVEYVVTHSLEVYRCDDNVAKLWVRPSARQAMAKPYSFSP